MVPIERISRRIQEICLSLDTNMFITKNDRIALMEELGQLLEKKQNYENVMGIKKEL